MIKKINQRILSFFLDTKSFGFFIGFTNLIWPLIPRMPKVVAIFLMNKKHDKVLKFIHINFKDVLNKYKALEQNNDYSTNLPIWFCWLQGYENMPKVTKECYKLVNKYAKNHPVILISLENFASFITLPQNILSKHENGLIGNAHLTDIIRTTLLAEKGGCWIDATVFLTNVIKEDIFKVPFYSIKYPNEGYYITENMWSNFFLVCQNNSILFRFVRDMFYEYLKKENRFIDYFMMDYFIKLGYNEIPSVKKMIDSVPLNNIHTLKLKYILNDEYSKSKLDFLMSETYLFKLNWRENYLSTKNGIRTNWDVLVNQ